MAERLLADYDARTPGQRLHPAPAPALALPEAYALQHEVTRLRERRGEKVIGYKVGCTSPTIREQLGGEQPIFGRLFDTGCLHSGVRLSQACYAHLAVEGELAVRLCRDVPGASVSVDECVEAVGAVFPVIELHHYVLPPAWSPGSWLLASNGLHAGFVLAEREKRCSGLPDFRHPLSIHIDGVAVEAFAESGTIPGPVQSLRWLAGRLAELGLRLREGQVVLTGSAMRLYPVSAGSRIIVDAGLLGQSCAEIGP
jgi:2-keto-4-pentenoate hydratase